MQSKPTLRMGSCTSSLWSRMPRLFPPLSFTFRSTVCCLIDVLSLLDCRLESVATSRMILSLLYLRVVFDTGRRVRKVLNCQVVQIKTSRGTTIVAAYVAIRKNSQRTILFSHGNAVDLGLMLPFYRWAASTHNNAQSSKHTVIHLSLESSKDHSHHAVPMTYSRAS